jgi:hypothetical protein
MAIPEADNSPLILILGFIPNRVVQELSSLAKVARRLVIDGDDCGESPRLFGNSRYSPETRTEKNV